MKKPQNSRDDGVPHAERRRFLRHGACASGLLLLGWRALPALAQDRPMLDPSAYQARALDYVQDAARAKDNRVYEAGQRCGNCEFFTASTQACGLFPDHRVATNGWCSSWTSEDS
ncbi:high-potential iron-sulfur protein [Salinicola halimionae]|uniref:high-potential iron-sulfur protein n=1 Tax=Salinicola halimionae TaxID=1949081 RepID=UPI000DA23956|nr:high-potential iron-sulfur protein [Salinicola halimionae]